MSIIQEFQVHKKIRFLLPKVCVMHRYLIIRVVSDDFGWLLDGQEL